MVVPIATPLGSLRYLCYGFDVANSLARRPRGGGGSRPLRAYSLLGTGDKRNSWDEAADVYFRSAGEGEEDAVSRSSPERDRGERAGGRGSERVASSPLSERDRGGRSGGRDSGGAGGWQRRETDAFERGSRAGRSEGERWRGGAASSTGGKSATFSPDVEENGGARGSDRSERTQQRWQTSRSAVSRDSRGAADRRSGYGREGNDKGQWWQKSGGSTRSGRGGEYAKTGRTLRSSGGASDGRWQPREQTPPLPVKGQPVYGVAPILSALHVARRELYCLYVQENLLERAAAGRRKDKLSVSLIEKTAKSKGVPVREASKHDLNLLVDSRPHQGLVLDASPLDLVSIDALEPPEFRDGGLKPPVWVALDEVTDPQNFGAILRSASFLGADGVVVCAKNSAPLSGVVSKASAGALETMEVHSCRNMMKFLDKCRAAGWRIVGASAADPATVSARALPPGIPTLLVLGSEGRGLRTNVRRACDVLVSVGAISKGSQRPPGDDDSAVDFGSDEEGGSDDEEGQEEGGEDEGGGEVGLASGIDSPAAVDSLNVSVAAGILLYELLGSGAAPPQNP